MVAEVFINALRDLDFYEYTSVRASSELANSSRLAK